MILTRHVFILIFISHVGPQWVRSSYCHLIWFLQLTERCYSVTCTYTEQNNIKSQLIFHLPNHTSKVTRVEEKTALHTRGSHHFLKIRNFAQTSGMKWYKLNTFVLTTCMRGSVPYKLLAVIMKSRLLTNHQLPCKTLKRGIKIVFTH